MIMDGLDQVTLVLLCILVLVAVLFPLTEGRPSQPGKTREREHEETREGTSKRR